MSLHHVYLCLSVCVVIVTQYTLHTTDVYTKQKLIDEYVDMQL